MRTVLRGALALMIILALPVAVLAHHSWSGYHWARTSNSFNLGVGDNMTTADWKQHLGYAITDWNTPTNTNNSSHVVLHLISNNGTSGPDCSAVSGTVQVCNGTYGSNGWLGLATIWISYFGKHITQGTAQVNDTYFNTSTYNHSNEKQHVVCQEIGHTFGLDHQSTSGADLNTCMDYFSNTGGNADSTDSTKPNAGDFDELLCIYDPTYAHKKLTSGPHTCRGSGHLDSSNTAAAGTGNAPADKGSAADTRDPNEWGDLVSQSANGRSSTYERHYADGSIKVTHVYWTLEAAENCPSCDHRYDH